MAKRKRLSFDAVTAAPAAASASATPPPSTAPRPPIANVAGATAVAAAQGDVVAELEKLRAEGRVILSLPLGAIEIDHLVRDRVASGTEGEDMAALIASLRAHGQRTPIEVVEIAPGRYGLISGWRRLSALGQLAAEDAEFGQVLALVRDPGDAGEAYIAMVEENEIRVGLSYYERARIAARAAEAGAFADPASAVDALYANGSKARRSKIRSFLVIHDALGGALRFPTHLPERLGLDLAQAIKAGQGDALEAALTPPADSPEAEAARLKSALSPKAPAKADVKTRAGTAPDAPDPSEIRHQVGTNLTLRRSHGRILLEGPGADADLLADLVEFLASR